MRSTQIHHAVPLSAVKPLERLLSYRRHCLSATRKALQGSTHRRERSPVGGARLEPCGEIEGLTYLRCPESGSLFLAELPDSRTWARLLAEVSEYRHSPEAFHSALTQSRTDTVYAPKLEWIQETLRLQGMSEPRILEAATLPSDFTELLKMSASFSDVITVDEMALAMDAAHRDQQRLAHVAVLLESLDRVDDPVALLRGISRHLDEGGLLFVTALVCSGFDLAVLGLYSLYLYPPDRANCFSLQGLSRLLEHEGFVLLEVSTPGVLDVEIVLAHLHHDPALPLSTFERQLLDADGETHAAFQAFLQQQGLSSFARIVARKR